MSTQEDSVRQVLRGFVRGNKGALIALAEVDDWRRIARQELERRATIIVQAFDVAALKEIESGVLDLSSLCCELKIEHGE